MSTYFDGWEIVKFVLISAAMAISATSRAAQHDETIHGDLSGDRLNPTQLVLSSGVNSITATTGAFGDEEIQYDLEYLRIDLPANHSLMAIRLEAYQADGDETAFIGVQSGTTFSFEPDDAIANIGNLYGYAHFGPGEEHGMGDDILADIGAGPGAIGFVAPLTGPSYTFWIQQTGSLTNYRLDFIVAGVPEPSSAVLSGMALSAVAAVGRHRRRRMAP